MQVRNTNSISLKTVIGKGFGVFGQNPETILQWLGFGCTNGNKWRGCVGCGEWGWWCWFRGSFKTTSQGRGLGAKNLKTRHASWVLSMLYPTTMKGNKER